ncbi:MAG TPA: DUF3187 family protein [Gemmatimonadales bacterium]|nr:DUF3187 family protein [Gemmatimonadales bacterium]
MTRLALVLALPLWLCCLPAAALAQGLPAYNPINPVADSRTPLGFEPYRTPRLGRWGLGLSLDYGSAVERGTEPRADYTLDAELLRLRLRVARDLSPAVFVMADASAQGSYAGFLDGFLNWYHSLIGIKLVAREERPENSFLYRLDLPDGISRNRRPSDLYLGDVRLSAGVRSGSHLQAIATVTLPTSTGPTGYGRGVVAAGLLTTVHAKLAEPWTYEGSLGLGYTPTHGDLADYQRTTFVSGSSGLRWRFWGRQSLYANLFYHSPYYHDTTIPPLDRRELSLDFGWILATKSGREWRIGMTEDMEPSGPAIDIVFRMGMGR